MKQIISKFIIASIKKYKIGLLSNMLMLVVGYFFLTLVYNYTKFESSYDSHFKNYDNIYVARQSLTIGGVTTKYNGIPPGLAPALANEFPEVIAFNRFYDEGLHLFFDENQEILGRNKLSLTDSSIFEMFDFEYIYGSIDAIYENTDFVVLTESTAKKYFGDENPINKTILNLYGKFGYVKYRVQAVIKDLPNNSHFDFDILASKYVLGPNDRHDQLCLGGNYKAYILLDEKASIEDLRSKIPKFIDKYVPKYNITLDLTLQPLNEVHTNTDLDDDSLIKEANNAGMLVLLKYIGFFIYCISLLNFTYYFILINNLEVKTFFNRLLFGESKYGVLLNFIIYIFIINLIALLVNLLIYKLLSGPLSFYCDPEIFNLSFKNFNIFLIILLCSTVIMSVLSYLIIWVQGFFQLSKTVNNRKTSSKAWGKIYTFQFGITAFLIMTLLTVNAQYKFLTNKKDGFNSENMLYVRTYSPILKEDVFKNMSKELHSYPNIKSVTGNRYLVGAYIKNVKSFGRFGAPEDEYIFACQNKVAPDFMTTFDIELLAGEHLDPLRKFTTVINEAMVKALGFNSNEEAVGQKIVMEHSELMELTVVGVMKDYHHSSKRFSIRPQAMVNFYIFEQPLKFFYVKLNDNNLQKGEEIINKVWGDFLPKNLFNCSIHTDYLRAKNKSEIVFLFFLRFALISLIIIIVIGIINITALTINNNSRSVAIRKVNGANYVHITWILIRKYLIALSIALPLSIPIAYLIGEQYKANFKYQSDFSILIIIYSIIIVLSVVLFAVASFVIRSARINPCEALKME